jgi:hypothetical protein
MQTNQTEPIIQETNLLRITTIKRKHASQIREAFRERPDWKLEDIEALHYIDEWDAILCRRKDNNHYLVIQGGAYYQAVQRGLKPGEIWSHKQAEIHLWLQALPQLFLD